MNVEQAFDFFKVRATQLGTRTRVVVARLFGVGQDGDTDEQQEPIEEAECLSPIGFKSRPKVSSTTEAFGVRLGDEVVVLCFVDKGATKLSDADLAEGEALMYGPAEPTATVRITKDGDIFVTAKSDRKIVLNVSGTGKVFLGGETGTEPVALADTLTTFLGSVKTWLEAHTHSGGTIMGNTGAPLPAVPPPSVPDFKSGTTNAKK